MIVSKKTLFFVALAAFAFSFLPAAAEPPAPADPAVVQVQGFYDVLLGTMKHAAALGVNGRFEKLKPAVEKCFDLETMLRVAAGAQWNGIPAAERAPLLAAFERKTVAEYASNFDGFSGEKFVVDPAAKPRGADKIVQSKLVAKDQTVAFGYRMRKSGNEWKILDIYLNGTISQLAMQRSDFAASLKKGGAPALTKLLNAKADKLLGK